MFITPTSPLCIIAAGASAVSWPTFDPTNPIVSTLEIVMWVALVFLAPAYYLHWAWPKFFYWLKNAGNWIRDQLKKDTRDDAETDGRMGVRARLGITLCHSAAQVLTSLRIAVVAMVGWHYWRLHSNGHELALNHVGLDYEPYLSWAFSLVTLVYLILINWARRRAEAAQEQIDAAYAAAPLSGPGGIWTRKLPDEFFRPAMIDVAYVLFMAWCLPSAGSDLHLALIVPAMSAWLFRNSFRIILLYAAIVITLLGSWYWTGFCRCKAHWDFSLAPEQAPHSQTATSPPATTSGSGVDKTYYRKSLVGQTMPRASFWLVVCTLMVIVRAIRRETEDQAAFFQGLAEAMPFDVFVKDRKLRFAYANSKLLAKLKRLPGQQNLSLRNLQYLVDKDLGIELAKRELYERIDSEILDGTRKYYEEMEPSFEKDSDQKILTIKVPIKSYDSERNPIDKARFVLGMTRHPDGDSDPFFFMDIVGSEVPHCFFRKNDGKFAWANEQFIVDAGFTKLTDILDKTDDMLYTPNCAEGYKVADSRVKSSGAASYEEEWHESINSPGRKRVHVVKKPHVDPDGIITGVRGYFRSIQGQFIRSSAVDLLMSKNVQDVISKITNHNVNLLTGSNQRTSINIIKALDVFSRAIRILSMRANELQTMQAGELPDSPKTYADLVWRSTPWDSVRKDTDLVLGLLRFAYPNITFHAGQWHENHLPVVDPNWLKTALYGLGLSCALRVTTAIKTNPQLPDSQRQITFRFGLQDGNYFFSATDRIPDIDFSNGSPPLRTVLEHTPVDCETIAAGFQIAERVASLGNGAFSVQKPVEGHAGAAFHCSFPILAQG